jgi:glycosyltransferase involved in cell wall biosynthesis
MRIIHVFRSPVGGLFRHVRDLAEEQSALGHDVGIIVSADAHDQGSATALSELAPHLRLGMHKFAISRLPSASDVRVVGLVRNLLRTMKIDIAHGHGAKGGLLARLSGVPSVYTPHGGSLHYRWSNPAGAAFLTVEKALVHWTGGFIFVCDFERREFEKKIGLGNRPNIVVHNGLRPIDFEKIEIRPDATDLLFVGEMRDLKGVDVLLKALQFSTHSATLVGEGPDRSRYQEMAKSLGLENRVNFPGRMPFRDALKLGRVVVLPSRNEAFPYVVLEALAAGRIILASDVGGVGEVLGQEFLAPAGNVSALSDKINTTLKDEFAISAKVSNMRLKLVDNFSISQMATRSIAFYKDVKL